MLGNKTDREKVLLIGGGGFLGTTLLERLHSDYEVVCLDRGTRYARLEPASTSVRFVRGTADDIGHLFAGEHFNHLFYLAGGNAVRVAGAKEAESESARRALDATIEFLLASGNRTALTYFSSYLCYASSEARLTEDSTVGDSPYAQLHRMNEDSLRASGILHAVVRLSTVYGRYGFTGELHSGGVLGRFISLMVQSKPVRINNGGLDGMDFLCQEDFVTACRKRLENGTASGIYNLGSGTLTSIARLASILNDALFETTGLRSEMTYANADPAIRPEYRYCATEKFEQAFGWKAKHSVEQEAPRLLAEELKALGSRLPSANLLSNTRDLEIGA